MNNMGGRTHCIIPEDCIPTNITNYYYFFWDITKVSLIWDKLDWDMCDCCAGTELITLGCAVIKLTLAVLPSLWLSRENILDTKKEKDESRVDSACEMDNVDTFLEPETVAKLLSSSKHSRHVCKIILPV